MNNLSNTAKKLGVTAAVFTFDRHPKSLFLPGNPTLISTKEERTKLLMHYGIDHVSSFPVTEELKGRTIPIDSAMFRYPYRLEVGGDRVVIEDLHGPDHYYHLFTYPEFRYLSSLLSSLFGAQLLNKARSYAK